MREGGWEGVGRGRDGREREREKRRERERERERVREGGRGGGREGGREREDDLLIIASLDVSVAHSGLPRELPTVMLVQVEALENAACLGYFRRQLAL